MLQAAARSNNSAAELDDRCGAVFPSTTSSQARHSKALGDDSGQCQLPRSTPASGAASEENDTTEAGVTTLLVPEFRCMYLPCICAPDILSRDVCCR